MKQQKNTMKKRGMGLRRLLWVFFFLPFLFYFVSSSASRRSFMVDAAGYIKGSSCIGHIVLVEITGPKEFLYG